MADRMGQRMTRREAWLPTEPNRLLSDEAMQYMAALSAHQQKALDDPYCKGSDPYRRYREGQAL